jgi:lipopolysaccharide transport system permease protein
LTSDDAAATHKTSKWVLKQDHGFHPIARFEEAWGYRLLVVFFASHAFSALYKKTQLGIIWVPLRPLAPLIVGAVIYGGLMNVPSVGVPYFLMLTVGSAAWNCFDGPWTWGTRGLELNRDLISKLYFPRIILPLSTMVPGLAEPAVNIVIAVLAFVYYRVSYGTWYVQWGPRLLFTPLLLLAILFLAFSLSLFTSVYQVRARDVRFLIGYALGFWMYITPIIYPATQIPLRWRWLMWFNPMAALVEEFKAAVFGWARPPAWALPLALAEIFVVFAAGFWHFHAMESQTADKV